LAIHIEQGTSRFMPRVQPTQL